MDLRLSVEEENFRQKIVTFIDESFPLEARESPSPAEVEHWHQAVVNKGWSAPEWPVLAGGPGWSKGELFIWYVTTAESNCPQPDDYALQVVAPLLLEFGNVAQQSHLPQILNRTAKWGNAVFFDGSADINAEDRGDCYQINGQVVCIAESGVDHLLLLADTGGGHSLFVIDLTLDGINFEPEEPANNIQTVIFDKTAVPVSCLLGEVNLAAKYLEYIYVEKQSVSQIVHLEAGLNYLKEVVQTFGLQSEMENPVAAIEIELSALKITGLRHNLSHKPRPKPPTHSQQSSGNKETQVVIVKGLNLAQQIGDSLVDALGYYAIPADQVLPGSNEPKPVFSASLWKSSVMDIMPGCPRGFRQDLIAKTLLGL